MTEALAERRYTIEDLERLEDPGRFELIDGELVELDMGMQASVISINVLAHLAVFVQGRGLGYVGGAESTLDIFGGVSLPRPDGVFISMESLAGNAVPAGHLTFVPDLVIEVVSPNDIASNVNKKVERYLEAGIKLVWVAWPETQTVGVYRADGTVLRLTKNATLSGEDVVPGFELPLSKVFVV